NAAPDYSPMDGYSAVEDHQKHPLNSRNSTRIHYRAQQRRTDNKPPNRKRARNKSNYKDDKDDAENKECGSTMASTVGRILNGKLVKPLYRYPWIVPLMQKNKIKCGGAIISRKFILTAAHCVFNDESLKYPECQGQKTTKKCYLKPDQLSIKVLGKKQLGKKFKIKRIIPHPKFDYDVVVYDIALLELEKPLECSRKTSPVCLPTKNMYETGQKIFIAGWGMDTPEGFSKCHILPLKV
ncbi:hypothetical protein TNCT_278291, partial [Trichonephila clavata]